MKKEWKKANKSEKSKEIKTEGGEISAIDGRGQVSWEVASLGLSQPADVDGGLWPHVHWRRFADVSEKPLSETSVHFIRMHGVNHKTL